MPIGIHKVSDGDGEFPKGLQNQGQSLLDFFLPKFHRDGPGITDTEAKALYSMWKSSPPGSKTFACAGSEGVITPLQLKGYVSGGNNGEVALTERGRKVIIEMVTNEPNALDKKADVTYSSIQAKAKAGKRQIQSFTKKASFNLREQSLRNMRGEGNNNQ